MGIELTPHGRVLMQDGYDYGRKSLGTITISDLEIKREGMKRYKFYHPACKHPVAIFDGDERSSEALKAMKMLLITRRLTK
jgi:hypothetical protein